MLAAEGLAVCACAGPAIAIIAATVAKTATKILWRRTIFPSGLCAVHDSSGGIGSSAVLGPGAGNRSRDLQGSVRVGQIVPLDSTKD